MLLSMNLGVLYKELGNIFYKHMVQNGRSEAELDGYCMSIILTMSRTIASGLFP